MIRNESGADVRDTPARLWRFADCAFDELRRELRLRGTPVELESKPLEALIELLQHAGFSREQQTLLFWWLQTVVYV